MRLGVLASGGGTTFQAILDACDKGRLAAGVGVLVSNLSRSGAAERARQRGIPFVHCSTRTHPDPDERDGAMLDALVGHDCDWIFLAGYLKKIGPRVLERYGGRILNTHPALLPKFGGPGMYGRHVHEAVLAAGETVSGASVHLVDADYDTGPVIARAEVPVLREDTPETLAARVQERERQLVVETLVEIEQGRLP